MLVPLISVKGSWIHVRSGQIYAVSMGLGMLFAFAVEFAKAPYGLQPFDWFLTMIAVFTSVMIYDGVRALRLKSRTESTVRRILHGRGNYVDVLDVLLSAFGLGFAIFVMVYGLIGSNGLLTWFPILPISIHSLQLLYWITGSIDLCGRPQKMHW